MRTWYESIHLCQQLVQRLLTLFIGAHSCLRPLDTQGINLVHKDDAGLLLGPGPLEQVTHAGCTHTHNGFHKLTATHLQTLAKLLMLLLQC